MAKTLSFTDTSPQTVKIGDTTTSFTLICGNDNVATDLTNATSITAKLGNASGYLKSATVDPTKLADPTTGQVTVTFTADLMTSLPAGSYSIEVWIVDSTGTSIYPTDGSAGFSINNNIQNSTGSTITTITFDEFVNKFNDIVAKYQAGEIKDGSITADKLAINAQQTIFSPGNAKKPNFDTTTRQFDFGSTTPTTPTIQTGTKIIPIPNGTIANPTDRAMHANSLRVVYNENDSTAQVIAYDESLPQNTVVVCFVVYNYQGHAFISGGFPYTINGAPIDTQKSNIDLVVSSDGAPIFNKDDNSLDLNCYTDSAYIIFDGGTYQIPRNTIIEGVPVNNRSVRYLFNPDTKEFKSITWNVKIELGWVQIAAVRKTKNNEVLITSNFPITVKGASFKSRATDNPLNAKIKGINHRGFNTVAPEESRSAYLLSKRNGYHHWEGDINWTKDNVPMMIHDLAINRTARNLDGSQISGTVNITDLNYADLAKYDFGIIKGNQYKGEPLLSFEELVKLARYNDTFLHIEFKYAFTQEQVQILHNIVVKYNMLDRIGWQAFVWDNLKPMMALEPNGQYELLGGNVTDDYFTKMAALKTDTNTIIASQNAALSVDDIQKIADKGYPIYLWTVDDGDTVRKFRDIGMVEGIMTNGAINVTDELTK